MQDSNSIIYHIAVKKRKIDQSTNSRETNKKWTAKIYQVLVQNDDGQLSELIFKDSFWYKLMFKILHGIHNLQNIFVLDFVCLMIISFLYLMMLKIMSYLISGLVKMLLVKSHHVSSYLYSVFSVTWVEHGRLIILKKPMVFLER